MKPSSPALSTNLWRRFTLGRWLHHQQIPLMLMCYLGCLKTLIYAPIFKLFGNGAYAVREPALIFGAASVWLFFLLLRRIAGNRAA